MKDIRFGYGALQVLRGVSLGILPGEIHAMVGEHGAGKSSIARIASGLLKPQGGTLACEGRSLPFLTLRKARSLGIEIVTQHSPLFDHLSVAKNLLVNTRVRKPTLHFTERRVERRAAEFLEGWGFGLSVSTEVRDLSLADRVLVDILRHLHESPRLLILDEALEKLTKEHQERVVALLNRLRTGGMSLLYITHHIDDVYTIADRVSVLRAGEIILTEKVPGIDKLSLIRLAYTRAWGHPPAEDLGAEFYHLLKYNQAILEKLPVNLIVVDVADQVKLINECAAKHFSLARGYPSSLPLSDLFPGEDRLLDLLRTCGKRDRAEVLLNIPIRLGGTPTVNTITTLPIFDESTRIGTIILMDDVTEREKMREQIVLSEKLASLGLLAAGIAHEINNPLEIIANCLDYLRTGVRAPEMSQPLQDIEEEIAAISRIVRSFLSFAGDGSTEREKFNLSELAMDTVRFVQREASRRGIVIHPPEPSTAEVFASPVDVRHVLLNILKNALEALNSGGEIHVSVTELESSDVPSVEMCVTDSGPGISFANITDIFLPFFSSKKQEGKNYGLGLYTSYSLVQRNGGTIGAENLASGGCRFSVNFPLATSGT